MRDFTQNMKNYLPLAVHIYGRTANDQTVSIGMMCEIMNFPRIGFLLDLAGYSTYLVNKRFIQLKWKRYNIWPRVRPCRAIQQTFTWSPSTNLQVIRRWNSTIAQMASIKGYRENGKASNSEDCCLDDLIWSEQLKAVFIPLCWSEGYFCGGRMEIIWEHLMLRGDESIQNNNHHISSIFYFVEASVCIYISNIWGLWGMIYI